MLVSIRLFLKLRFSKDRTYYQMLRDLFGFFPNNIELYKLALIHRSASLYLDNGTVINNERLEFLGDSIIEAIVSDHLFIEFPDKDEGYLTQLRSKVVSRSTLNQLALTIGLDRYVIVQGGGALTQKHLYGDALEAMIGAIYLDKGYDFANRLLIDLISRNNINLGRITSVESDFKSRLLEWGQKNKEKIKIQTVPAASYTHRNPAFETRILWNGQEICQARGDSKKASEKLAARRAIKYIRQQESLKSWTKIDEN